ncbi:hypothetical protein C8R45DRAFT_1016317 [Mycena sanguinolenta]|nr:hypothetical protein C8R45DRAFT_1016317 [Mycena sanguinolenta]
MSRVDYVRKQPFDHGLIDWRIFCRGQVRKWPKRASWPGVGTARSISLSRTLAGSRQLQMQLTSCGVTNIVIVEPRGSVSGAVNSYSAQPPQGPHQSSEKEANGQSTRGRTKANGGSVLSGPLTETDNGGNCGYIDEIHRRRCHGPQRLFPRFGAGIQATEAEDGD